MLTENDIKKQSETAYRQWSTQWREHAKIHSKYPMKSFAEFKSIGVGRAVLCVATGYSYEAEIETIKKYQSNVDIMCCDKSLGTLLDNGIVPTYCHVADANVNYEKYLKPWQDKLSNTILMTNVCANPLWTSEGNWKDRFFFCVMDILQSEKEFMALSGCPNKIAAGTNVSNGLVILLTQCENNVRQIFFGYDKILLIGFDYSWSPDGKYYAFDETGNGKSNYMRHVWLRDLRGESCWTSTNLMFSAKWLLQYITAFNLPVIQCGRRSIFGGMRIGDLAEQMQYKYKVEDANEVKRLIQLHAYVEQRRLFYINKLSTIARDHHYSYLATV